MFETLLKAALDAAVGLLVNAGFGDEVKPIREFLTKADEKKRRRAFERAIDRAIEAAGDEGIRPLLQQQRIQEEIIAGLLDPTQGINFQNVADLFIDRYPKRARPIRQFFTVLENAMMKDETWGPVLSRFQDLRFREDVRKILHEGKLDISPHELVGRLYARLIGPGAIAQDGSVAAGAGGLAVKGDVQQVVQVLINEITLCAPSPFESHSLRRRYLQELARDSNLLPWNILNPAYADPEKGESLCLAEVYTDLDTMKLRAEREEDLRKFMASIHEKERIPAKEAANREQCLLIMGDPGSGKSTFLKHLAYTVAQAGLADEPAPWLKALSPWKHGTLFPVFVELRQVSAFAEEHPEYREAHLLLHYLHHMLTLWKLDGFWTQLEQAIREEAQPLLMLLDGLDEVPSSSRQMVVDMVNGFREHYPWHRYLVTCRPYAYVGQPWRLSGFYEVTLAPFSISQIDRFVRNWYGQLEKRNRLSRQDAIQGMEHLQHAIQRPYLRGLAERPLLLTVMAQLHAFKGKLPEDRTRLYADAVELLLQRWQTRVGKKNDILERLDLPDLRMSDIEAGLYQVAYMAHSMQSHGETADIEEGDLRRWLAPYMGGSYDRAGVFVEYIRERAGLLIRHKKDAYTFPHRTFQEFLASCYLTATKDYPGEAARLVSQDMDRWREVFLLSAGHSARSHRLSQAVAAVNALCPWEVDRGVEDPLAWQKAQIAGEALLEIGLVGVKREDVGRALLERVQGWLVTALRQDKVLTPKERASSGRILAKLVNTRPKVLEPERIEFCHVPAGAFTMGIEDKPGSGQSWHVYTIPYDYKISRYPVTNAQFNAFINAGGYSERRYWKEAEAFGYWRDGKVKRRVYDESKGGFTDEFSNAPFDFGEPYSLSNHPVVGINWYEALAFTRWLTEKLHTVGELREGWKIHLPSEAEWEKAARGTDAWIYPWGNEPDPNRANYDKTGIGATSPVGCFPGGASPYGVEDMSGNVWEWTRSLWGKDWEKQDFGYPYNPMDGRERLDAPDDVKRVLRGGSFNRADEDVRCAVRVRDLPDLRSRFGGFRVVASPFTSEL